MIRFPAHRSKARVVMCACGPSVGEAEAGGSLNLNWTSLVERVRSGFIERVCLKKKKAGERLKKTPRSASGLQIHLHTYVGIHMNTLMPTHAVHTETKTQTDQLKLIY